MMYQWSTQMPDTKVKEQLPKRVDRFIYSEDDIDHIFRLGDIGTVFGKNENIEKSSILLKKLIPNKKKLNK